MIAAAAADIDVDDGEDDEEEEDEEEEEEEEPGPKPTHLVIRPDPNQVSRSVPSGGERGAKQCVLTDAQPRWWIQVCGAWGIAGLCWPCLGAC